MGSGTLEVVTINGFFGALGPHPGELLAPTPYSALLASPQAAAFLRVLPLGRFAQRGGAGVGVMPLE